VSVTLDASVADRKIDRPVLETDEHLGEATALQLELLISIRSNLAHQFDVEAVRTRSRSRTSSN
jgi:hypothetical protein